MAVLSSSLSSLRARTGVLAISGGAVLWGTTGVVAHAVHAHTGLAATSIAFYRTLVAALVLAAGRGHALVRFVASAGPRRLAVLALAGASLGISQALYYIAVDDVGVSIATLVCIGAAPIAVTCGSAVALRRWPAPSALATLGCALAGLGMITTSTDAATGSHPAAGVLAALGSGLAYAASTGLSRRLASAGDAFTLTGATSIAGALTLLPAAFVAGLGFPVDGRSATALLYLGIVPTVLAYALFFRGLRTTSAEVAAVLTLIEPLVATLLAVVLLGEALTARGWLGAVLLLAAVGVLLARQPETPVESAAPMG
jgi:DME family drug/metabolite transporter